MKKWTIELIRHGQTAGNVRGSYLGRTEEDLTEEGIAQAEKTFRGLAPADAWILSPMRRCLETACLAAGAGGDKVWNMICQGENAKSFLDVLENTAGAGLVRTAEGLRECDFGLFENRTWREMQHEPLYQAWIDSGGKAAFPEGEDPADFQERCCASFEQQLTFLKEQGLKADACIRFVVHGGTIMSIMDRYALQDDQEERKTYYDWRVENCGSLRRIWNGCFPIELEKLS